MTKSAFVFINKKRYNLHKSYRKTRQIGASQRKFLEFPGKIGQNQKSENNNKNKTKNMDEETWDGPKLASEAEEDLDFDKLGGEADDEDEDDDPDSEEFEVQLSPSDERLLEELLRMKLTSLPHSPASSGEVMRGKMSSLLPKTNLEQFEDIIFESQLFEAALPNLGGKN